MSFIKSGILGLFIGIYLGIFGLVGIIPVIGPIIAMFGAICLCLFNPLIMVALGFVLCKLSNVKAGDYGAAGINLLVYSFTGASIFAIISFITQLLGFGVGAAFGGDLTTLGFNAAGGIIGVVFGWFIQFVMLFIFGLVGAVIYLITKK
jgi:hypothetical protein